MTVFTCTECGAEFRGDLRQASHAAFRHTAEHAAETGRQDQKLAGPAENMNAATAGLFTS